MRVSRRHGGPAATPHARDARSESQRDRDRILYTSAFRRLDGVTQVVGPIEGHVFHNRLTHTLEVAQIARRLAERLRGELPEGARNVAAVIDPEVVEAAALAHDLGHPPFGHIAEHELNRLTAAAGGYEGNAQSFRIITRLSAHRRGYKGLNLTRATLAATLKYPWLKTDAPKEKPTKFGAYITELDDFKFAVEHLPAGERSLEAQIMDHADSVAYSVHDLEDFYRAGLVPLERLVADFDRLIADFSAAGKVSATAIAEHKDSLWNLVQLLPTSGRYQADLDGRVLLRSVTSRLINDFLADVSVTISSSGAKLSVPPHAEVQMRFLQNLIWKHVISSPRLATQQHGQRKIVRTLFRVYHGAMGSGDESLSLIPAPFRSDVTGIAALTKGDQQSAKLRLAADIVASFSDRQATALYRRLTGQTPGSVMDLMDS